MWHYKIKVKVESGYTLSFLYSCQGVSSICPAGCLQPTNYFSMVRGRVINITSMNFLCEKVIL